MSGNGNSSRRGWKWALVATVCGSAASLASADEFINTGEPGGFLGFNGFDLYPEQSVAVAFTPLQNSTLDSVKLWMMCNDFEAPGRTFTLTLRSANASDPLIPGTTIIETWNTSTTSVGWTPILETFPSVAHPVLTGATKYWIVAESNEPAGFDPLWVQAPGGATYAINNSASPGWIGSDALGGAPGIIVLGTPSGPAACNAADVAGLGGSPGHDGQNTVDDLVYYLSQFFAGNTAVADLTNLGGTGGPDGQITVDDLVAFLGAFFSPCNP